MPTKDIVSQYRLLLSLLQSQHDRYSEQDLAIFNFAKGAAYKNDLLVVGRAVNGWNRYNKYNLSDKLPEIKNNILTDDLEWVNERWGINDGEYNTRKSAFWRVTKKLSLELIGEQEDIFSHIAWSNLYKASKYKRGNPSSRLMNVQFEMCKIILTLEIEVLKPKIVVFLTALAWAKWFLDDLDIEILPINPTCEFVEFVGKYKSALIIVGQHPQGKAEEPHYREILAKIKKIKATEPIINTV